MHRQWTTAAVFLLCALPRLVVLALSAPPELTFYWYLSGTLLGTGSFGTPGSPDTHIEPLYPAFLAAARWLTGERMTLVLTAQIAVASCGGVLLYRLTQTLFGDSRAAWIAAFLYAFDPYLVRQSIGLMEVSLLTAILIAVAWSFTVRQNAVLTGLVVGIAILTRFSMAPLALFVPALLWRRSPKHGVLALVCAVAVVLPWSVRSYRVDGSLAPSRIGANLAASTSSAAEQLLPQHNPDRLVPLLGEKTDAEFLASALQFARAHPWRTLKMKLRNLLHVFNPRLLPYAHEPRTASVHVENGRYVVEGAVPRPQVVEWVHGLWRAALLLLAVAGVWLRGFRWEDGVLWAVVLTITAVCTVFYPTTRLATPMVFAWAVFAAAVLRRLHKARILTSEL